MDTKKFKTDLLARRNALVELAEHAEGAKKPVELDQTRVGRLSRMDAMQGQAMEAALEARRHGRIRAIDAALRRIEEGEQKVGGIIIPDTAKEKPQQGKVIAVGKGKVRDDGKVTPLDVKKGDKVLFGKYAGTEIKIDGEEHLIMREDDILGVIEG